MKGVTHWRSVARAGGWLLALMPLVLIAGCSGLPTRSAVLAEEESGDPSGQWVTAFGTGETPEKAREVALGHLAESVVTVVESRWRSEQVLEDGELTTNRAQSVVTSLTRLALSDAETAEVRPYQGGHYVRVRLPRSEMDRLQDQARAKAAAYAHLDRLEALADPQAGERLRTALQGLSAARRDGVLEGAVAVEGQTTTFGSYFREQARDAAASLRLLPVYEPGRVHRVRLHVVHETSLAPQQGLDLEVAGEARTSGDDGGIAVRGAEARPGNEISARLALPGVERALSSGERLLGPVSIPEPSGETRLYVHSTVDGVPVRVRRGGRRVAELNAPGNVAVASGADYRLTIPDGRDYRGVEEAVRLERDVPLAYRILRPQQAQHGRLRLEAPDSATWLYVAGPDGQMRRPGEIALEEARSGPYRVVVARPGDGERQQLRDAFVLSAGQEVARRYRPLPHRLPYQGGYSLGVTALHPGRGPGDDYGVPGGTFGDYRETDNAELADLRGVVVDFQSFWPPWPLTWQVSAGALRGEAEMDTGQAEAETVADLNILQASAGLGLYAPLWRGADPALAGWVTGGAAVESAAWDDSGSSPDGTPPRLPGGRATNQYSYLEAGLHWGWLKVAARWPLDRVEPHLQVGLGWLDFRSGYRRPPAIDARPGLHYESAGGR